MRIRSGDEPESLREAYATLRLELGQVPVSFEALAHAPAAFEALRLASAHSGVEATKVDLAEEKVSFSFIV